MFMGPMEGITDLPFRSILREHGCNVICTQMIHAEALLHGKPEKIAEVATMNAQEQPVGLQLCGPTFEVVGEAAKKAQNLGAAFIDLNMGCPAKNVVKIGAGAAYMKAPERAAALVKAVVGRVTIPVTVKIRAGWDDELKTALEVAKATQEEGAALLTVHARTRSQRFKGQADWSLIKKLKETLSIPVIGNGDVFTPEDAEKMFQVTGADGVMAARGALGNPWLFEGKHPNVEDIQKTVLKHLQRHLDFYPRKELALKTFRKHLVWYTKGLHQAAEFRWKVFKKEKREEVIDMINEYFHGLKDRQTTRNLPGPYHH